MKKGNWIHAVIITAIVALAGTSAALIIAGICNAAF
jgi:hypothetical protein